MDDDVREGEDDEDEEERDSAATVPPDPIQKSPLQYLSSTCNVSDVQEMEMASELSCVVWLQWWVVHVCQRV